MFTKIKTIGVLAVVVLMLSVQAIAQPQGAKQGPKADPNEIGILKKIPGLTADQETKIKALHLNLVKQILPIKNELAEKEAHLQTLSTAEKADMKAINATIDEISVLKTKMAKLHMQFRQDVRALLTEEQRVTFDMHQGKGMGPKGKAGYGKGNCAGHPGQGANCKQRCDGNGPNN